MIEVGGVLMNHWIYRNARPLELSLYQYFFQQGSKENVLNILSHFQNEDGGFAYGLEPDSLNPNSCPIQTWVATCIIRDLQVTHHPIIDGILSYLEKTEDQKAGHYPFTIPSNDLYPHASWWSYNDRGYEDFNPTASLQGFVLRYGKQSPIYNQALIRTTEIIDSLILHGSQEMHELNCIIQLLEDIQYGHLEYLFRFKTFKEVLIQNVHDLIEKDTSKWSDYTALPTSFIKGPDSIFYKGLEELTKKSLDHLESKKHPDGYWDINWSWDKYPEDFSVIRQWWRGHITVNNLRILQAFK